MQQTTLNEWLGRLPNHGKPKSNVARVMRECKTLPMEIPSCDVPETVHREDEDVWQMRDDVPRVRRLVGRKLDFDAIMEDVEQKSGQEDGKSAKIEKSEVFDSSGEVVLYQESMGVLGLLPSLDPRKVDEMMKSGVCPFCHEVYHTPLSKHAEESLWQSRPPIRWHLWPSEEQLKYRKPCTGMQQFKSYAESIGLGKFWCNTCGFLSENLWRSDSPANLKTKAIPHGVLFMDCDETCKNSRIPIDWIRAYLQRGELRPLDYFCFSCLRFTNEVFLLTTMANKEVPYIFRTFEETMRNCDADCPKRAEFLEKKKQLEPTLGKYWCRICQVYSSDLWASDSNKSRLPFSFVHCTCWQSKYWCTECRGYSLQLFQRCKRYWNEPEQAPDDFKMCPLECKRLRGKYEDIAFCRICEKPTSTEWQIHRDDPVPYADWPACQHEPVNSGPGVARADSAQGMLTQRV